MCSIHLPPKLQSVLHFIAQPVHLALSTTDVHEQNSVLTGENKLVRD